MNYTDVEIKTAALDDVFHWKQTLKTSNQWHKMYTNYYDYYLKIMVPCKQVTVGVCCLRVSHYIDDREGEALQHFGN